MTEVNSALESPGGVSDGEITPPAGVVAERVRLPEPQVRSRYLEADILGVKIARMYSNMNEEPYFTVVGEFDGYDVCSVDGSHRIEVKSETTSRRTGNAALELWNTELDRPSGILGTTADTWLHIVEEAGKWTGYEFDIGIIRRIARRIRRGEEQRTECPVQDRPPRHLPSICSASDRYDGTNGSQTMMSFFKQPPGWSK